MFGASITFLVRRPLGSALLSAPFAIHSSARPSIVTMSAHSKSVDTRPMQSCSACQTDDRKRSETHNTDADADWDAASVCSSRLCAWSAGVIVCVHSIMPVCG